MSQQIQASTPSPVYQEATTPQVTQDQGTTSYPQWVPQGVAPTPVAPSAPTVQSPQQGIPGTVPSTNVPFNPSTSQSSPNNPWEAAMGSLERVISNLPSQSPNQTQPYQSQEQRTVQTPNSLPTQVQPWAYQQQQQAPQTSNTNVSRTPTGYQVSSPVRAQDPTKGLSGETKEVVRHFGIEAPAILNKYSTQLEDLLVQQAQKFDEMNSRGLAMQTILTNPDHLADYTDRFFTEVYPVDIDGPQGQQMAGQPQQYQQQFDMPAPPANAGGQQMNAAPQQQWDGFGDVMNRSPENAWRYLQNMGPDALKSKLLFMEGA